MSLDVLSAWRRLLGDLGNLGDALGEAIERGDVVEAIAAMIQARGVRSALSRVEGPMIEGELAELEAILEVRGLVMRARATEARMTQWLERKLPGDARLLATPLGVALLADALLPAVWDFETDLVVLVGAELAPVAQVLADLGQRRIVLVGEVASEAAICVRDVEEVSAAVRTLVPLPPNQITVRATAGANVEMTKDVTEAAKTAVSDLRIHRNTVRAFSRTWVEQGLANLPSIAKWPSIADVGDAFAGVPMVIVAPGPSLKNNAMLLAGLKGKAIITCFSHSLKPVLAAGVTPDLILTVDPQDVRYHFAGQDLGDACVANAATVNPALFDLDAKQFLTLSANSAIDDWIFDGVGHEALVPGGGSVATSAFSLALRWKCDPIVFVGLDLSFPNGEYYVATSTDGAARAVVDDKGTMRVTGWSDSFHAMKSTGGPAAASERGVELPGWSGGTVPSSFMFALFHRWFVERMKSVTSTVYNCTEGGAFIAGMHHVPLASVSLSAGVDVATTLKELSVGDRSAKVAAHLRTFVRGLRRAKKLAQLARRQIATSAPGLERTERALAATLEPLAFASLLAQREVERASDTATRSGSERDLLAASSSLFSTLLTVIDQLEPGLTRALRELAPKEHHHGHAA